MASREFKRNETLAVAIKAGRWETWTPLKEEGSHAAYFALFFYKDLKVLIDDGDGQQDTGARTNGSKEVGHYRQTTDTESTKGGSCWNVPRIEQNLMSLTVEKATTMVVLLYLFNVTSWDVNAKK